VVEFLGGGRLEGEDLAALRVDAGHDVFDGAVLASGVHRLEDQAAPPICPGRKVVLQLRQRRDAGSERFPGLVLVLVLESERIAGVNVLQSERLPLLTRNGSAIARAFFDDGFGFMMEL